MKRGLTSLVLLAVLLGTSSCRTPFVPSPHPRNDENVLFPHKLDLIHYPKGVYEDSLYPKVYTRQSFRWANDTSEWEVRFPLNIEGAYGGFILRQALDLSSRFEVSRLTLRMKPQHMMERLEVALISHQDGGGKIMVRLRLAEFLNWAHGRWGTVSIPLKSFPQEGEVINKSGKRMGHMVKMDWTRVREIRLMLTDPLTLHEKLLIRSLYIRSRY